MKMEKGIIRVFNYIFLLLIFLFFTSIIGCGGGGGGGSNETAPTIDNVVLTDENFNPKTEFYIGDTANFLLTATDPDKNMEELVIWQYYPSNSTGNPYYGPDVIGLPSQPDSTMTFYLIGGTTIDGPSGNWRIEFQVEDSTGLESNVFKVYALVNEGGGGGDAEPSQP